MENFKKPIKKAAARLRGGAGAPDFWALVRAVENAHPSKPRLGHGETPGDECVRFGQMPHLHFPPTDIAEIVENARLPELDAAIIVYFFGLLGVNGPMPLEFTSYVFRRSHNHFDNTWRRFLDIIHHRFLTFYYRAYSANQQAISFDRSADDPFSEIVKSLAGFAPDADLPARQERIVLKSARHFSLRVKNRAGLEATLRRTFGLALEVRDFIPAAYDIPPDSYALLGRQSSTLGVNLQIGRTYASVTGKFEIHIGPVPFEAYQEFMSSQSGAGLLAEAVSLYLDRPLDYSVVFSVRRDTIPLAQLGFDLKNARWDAPRLGYTCWIGNPEERIVVLTIAASRFTASLSNAPRSKKR
ncbi:MAG: type VI secretion system baseplate subunit TssG [Spirochaetaceae bacterium]|jgi:type VI secretion system protein ImpH|nr:type VI secretion system baseplate subunit TssG [Spirochaetaceae bacterium]